jgi:hypothetical protein
MTPITAPFPDGLRAALLDLFLACPGTPAAIAQDLADITLQAADEAVTLVEQADRVIPHPVVGQLLDVIRDMLPALAMCEPRSAHGATCQRAALLAGRDALDRFRPRMPVLAESEA